MEPNGETLGVNIGYEYFKGIKSESPTEGARGRDCKIIANI